MLRLKPETRCVRRRPKPAGWTNGFCRRHPDLGVIRGGARSYPASGTSDTRRRNRLDASDVPSPHAPARPSTPSPPPLLPFSSFTTSRIPRIRWTLTWRAGIYCRQLQCRQQRRGRERNGNARSTTTRRRSSRYRPSSAPSRRRPSIIPEPEILEILLEMSGYQAWRCGFANRRPRRLSIVKTKRNSTWTTSTP